MNSIFQLLYKYLHWIVFIALEVACFVLLFSYNSYQGSVYLSTANGVIARLNGGKDKVTSYFGLAEENARLATWNASLQERVMELEHIVTSYRTDSLLYAEAAKRARQSGYRVTAAQVVDKSINKVNNYITLNRGAIDGIVPDMGVIGVEGVVGVVFKCTEHYSLVMPLVNGNSRLSCKLLRGGQIGYLQWHGADARYATLHDLPRYSNVEVGDTIVTSSSSSFFPEGIMVGLVEDLYPSSDGSCVSLKVALSTEFANLEHAFILQKMDADELKALNAMLNSGKKKKK